MPVSIIAFIYCVGARVHQTTQQYVCTCIQQRNAKNIDTFTIDILYLYAAANEAVNTKNLFLHYYSQK